MLTTIGHFQGSRTSTGNLPLPNVHNGKQKCLICKVHTSIECQIALLVLLEYEIWLA